MSRRILLLISTSLIVACAAVWAGYQDKSQLLPQNSVQIPQNQSDETVQVLVAASSIETGTTLAGAAVSSTDMLVRDQDQTFLIDTEENRHSLARLTAQRAIPKGTPFVQSDLIARPAPIAIDAPAGVPSTLQISQGMRAISVPVRAETAVAGLLANGDRVDVMVSFDHQSGARAIRTVLKNVRVVASDQWLGDHVGSPKHPPKTITLELHPEGAKVLALAQRTGDLVFVFSPPSQSDMPEIVHESPVLSTKISGERKTIAPPPKPVKVQVVRGRIAAGKKPTLNAKSNDNPKDATVNQDTDIGFGSN